MLLSSYFDGILDRKNKYKNKRFNFFWYKLSSVSTTVCGECQTNICVSMRLI